MDVPEPGAGQAGDDVEASRVRTRGQVKIVVDALEDQVDVARGTSDDDADFEYLYRRDHILVRDSDLSRVLRALPRARVDHNLVNGLTRVELPRNRQVDEVLAELDRELGAGVASPDHVLWVTGSGGSACPATEPEEPGTFDPEPPLERDRSVGAGVLVSVVDTGWHTPAAANPNTPWLAGVTGDEETITDPGDPEHYIRPYAGHGTFIAGVVRCQAPGAEVRVEGFLQNGGAIFESEMTLQLTQAIALGPDIISLSAGTTTRANRPTLSFEVLYENFLRHLKGTVLVAAAGNDHTRQPFWPAAFPWAISVGALDAHGERATFSNFGSWVDVYARGVDLVNGFPNGRYKCQEPPNIGVERTFKDGLAKWSGTSFATPVVAGRIAARMSATGLSARHAADELLAEARANAVPGVGAVL